VSGLQRIAGDYRLKFLALFILLCQFSNAADEATLRGALDAHRWFDLRDSALSGQVPTIYRFFVAVAFNDVDLAEKELSAAVRSGAYRDKLAGMYYAMNRLYFRLGQYHNGVVELRRCWSQQDVTPPDAEAEADAAALDRLPDQQVQSRRRLRALVAKDEGEQPNQARHAHEDHRGDHQRIHGEPLSEG